MNDRNVPATEGDFADRVMQPGAPDWDSARLAWNLVADQHPAAIAYVESPADAIAAVGYARERGLGIAAQGTGHGAACRASLEDCLLLRTERMRDVQIDPDARTGRFEAGVIWEDAAVAAGARGLAVPSGSAHDIGVVGYSTGGGFGWLVRRHGLACNRITAAELVTADGELRRIDAELDPDLFWAIRGGGGSFGVITALEFKLIELSEVYAGSIVYAADSGSRDIFYRWREWTRQVPDEVTSIARFLHLPPIPEVPEPLRDRPLITIGACYAGDPAHGAELIEPICSLAEPIMNMFEAMPPTGLLRIHMDPEEPVPGLVDTASLRELPDDAIDAFLEAAGPDSGSPLLMAGLRQAGGVVGRPAEGAGALSHINAEFLFEGIGLRMSPEAGEALNRHIDLVREAIDPWCTGMRYLNFADRPTGMEGIFDAPTLARLREVKRRYDPDDLIRGNQSVGVA